MRNGNFLNAHVFPWGFPPSEKPFVRRGRVTAQQTTDSFPFVVVRVSDGRHMSRGKTSS